MMHPTSTLQQQVIHPSQAYTTTPMAPPPSTITIVGVNNSSKPVVAFSSSEVTRPASQDIQEIPPKHHWISATLIP